jgi:EpsI family protein
MPDLIRFMVVYAIFSAVAISMIFRRDVEVPINRPFNEFPVQVKSWKMSKRNEFSDSVLGVLKPTDYLSRHYVDAGGKEVSLYIGYHNGGRNSGGIHSPKHCLPGSGWYEVSTSRDVLELSGDTINIVRAVYQKGETREMFLYWFQVRGRSISNEYSLKIAELVNSALYRRRDESFIRISVPIDSDTVRSAVAGEQFIRDFGPLLRDYLPR